MDIQQRDAAVKIAADILALLPDDPDAPAITVQISSVSELVGLLHDTEKNLRDAQARIVEQNTTREGIADRTREEIATYLESVPADRWMNGEDRSYAARLIRNRGTDGASAPPGYVMTREPRQRPITDNPQG